MALQPRMFPEIEGPDFVHSEEVEQVAQAVLSRHGKAGGVARLWDVAKAIRDEEIHVLWLLNTKPFDPEKEEVSHEVAGKCVKAPGLWRDLTGVDVAIWIREYFWDEASGRPDVREAMLLHEILHVEVKRDQDNQPKVAIRKHDIEDFVDVARQYGTVVGDGASYIRAAALFGTPEPTPLRSVKEIAADVEAMPVADQAVIHAAIDFKRSIEAGSTDVTITAADGRSTTIRGKGKGAKRNPMVEACPMAACLLPADHAGDHVRDDAL